MRRARPLVRHGCRVIERGVDMPRAAKKEVLSQVEGYIHVPMRNDSERVSHKTHIRLLLAKESNVFLSTHCNTPRYQSPQDSHVHTICTPQVKLGAACPHARFDSLRLVRHARIRRQQLYLIYAWIYNPMTR